MILLILDKEEFLLKKFYITIRVDLWILIK